MIVAPNTQSRQTPVAPPRTSYVQRVPQSALASNFTPRTQHAATSPSVYAPRSPQSLTSSSSYYAAPINSAPQSLSQRSLAAQLRGRSNSHTPNTPSGGIHVDTNVLRPSVSVPHSRASSAQRQSPTHSRQASSPIRSVYQQQQQPQRQSQAISPRRVPTFTDTSFNTFSTSSTLSYPSPISFALTQFASLTQIPPNFLIDRNTYNLDGTRAHPLVLTPSTQLDDLIDDILLPHRIEIDSNRYNELDGTRIHPPPIPDHIEFAREFAEFDARARGEYSPSSPAWGAARSPLYGTWAASKQRVQYRQQQTATSPLYGTWGNSGSGIRGPRLNPFAREFVPRMAASATTARTFYEIDRDQHVRKRAYSAV
ncbi:hypothetical protein BCR33DRAFT_714176 [Rhizoclosmatium globosum]|uniref:Uncharacterized protein n=1 Tax=Rhizoclosmatium globosum TaxID=329046 RepID=A0A1Y2CQ26_9FUNG|nr:hypothetical protein BCR33DRAFT_714176 [Rhizoclosmatium globosum]|eukprot:ORY49122.1 hypothetical protein BCR33DRAFT_714176 [Rhizoclosmatium globosum]